MEISRIEPFLLYYSRIRQRTLRVAQVIPEDKIEWTYRPGHFTLGDILRHIAALERYMWAENVQGLPSRYTGCGPQLAAGKEAVLAFMQRLHKESMEVFSRLSPQELQAKVQTPAGEPITCWKWLRAMTEHEIHHRGQLYIYLGMLGIATPPIFGLTSQEVIERSQRTS